MHLIRMTYPLKVIFALLILLFHVGVASASASFSSDQFGISVNLSGGRWNISFSEEENKSFEIEIADKKKIASFMLVGSRNIEGEDPKIWTEKERNKLFKWYGDRGKYKVVIVSNSLQQVLLSTSKGELQAELIKYKLNINGNKREVHVLQFSTSKVSYILFAYNQGTFAVQDKEIKDILKSVTILE